MILTLVKEDIVAKGTVSFFFSSDSPIVWKAGQYLVLKLNELERDFTISSSPTEGELIQITMRLKEGSEFKKMIGELEIGSKVNARGPFGEFVLDISDKVTQVFLAGGIGITPFRSMIKNNIDTKLNVPIYLIYSNSDSEFVFKNELDSWTKDNPNLKIEYIDTSTMGRIDTTKLNSILSTNNLTQSKIWIVGPKLFVDAMEDILEEIKIPQDQIKVEKFNGY